MIKKVIYCILSIMLTMFIAMTMGYYIPDNDQWWRMPVLILCWYIFIGNVIGWVIYWVGVKTWNL